MAFPIYIDNKNAPLPYLYSGIFYNSVLLLCIVFTITSMLIIYNLIDGIRRMYGYIKKQKLIKYKLKINIWQVGE